MERLAEYYYKPFVQEEIAKHHVCDFKELIVFGHPGKILECSCGKTKVISMFSDKRDYCLRDNI